MQGLTQHPAACLALCLALVCAACAKSVPDLVQEAKRNQAAGEVNASIINLKNALAKDPENAEAQELIGVTYANMGALTDAERELRKAMGAGGAARERVLPLFAKVLIDTEQYRQVLADLAVWSKDVSEPTQQQLSLLRGDAFLKMGDTAGAREQYESLADKVPLASQLGLVRVLAAENDIKGARRGIEEILRALPDDPDAWLVKGDLLRGQGNRPEALAAYRQSAKANPRSLLAHLAIAETSIALGDKAEARKEVEAARNIAPSSPNVHYTRALLALHEQKYEECEASLRSVFRLIPRHMPSVQLSGALFLATGKLEAARAAFSTYLTRYPGNLYSRRQLAAVFISLGQPQSAADVVEPMLSLGLADADMLGLAGLAYLQLGELPKARRYLEKAVAIDPTNVDSRTSLGVSRLASGDRIGGTADLESAMAMNAKSARPVAFLVMTLLAQNQFDRALRAIDELDQRSAGASDVQMLRGAVHLARGDNASARASYEQALKLKPGHFPAAAALSQMDLRDGDTGAARARMLSVLEHDKNNLDAMLALARLEVSAGKRADALGWIRRALGEHPQAFQPTLMLAQMQLQSGAMKEAVAAARQARKLNPGDPRVLEVLGQAQMAAGEKSEAVGTFIALAGLMPNSVSAQLQLASAYVANSEVRPAMAAAQRVLKLDRTNLGGLSLLGALYLQTNQVRPGLGVAQIMKQEHPRAPQGYALEGDALMLQGDFAKAASAFEKANTVQASGLLLVRQHDALTRAQKAPVDEAPLLEWVRDHPRDLKVQLYLADLYVKQAKSAQAAERYLEALNIEPENARILNDLAWVLQKSGDPRALGYAQHAYRLKPDDPFVLDTLGWAMVTQGNVDDGLLHLMTAVKLSRSHPEIRFHLAQALLKRGDVERARKELEALSDSSDGLVAAEARALLTRASP